MCFFRATSISSYDPYLIASTCLYLGKYHSIHTLANYQYS
jgi:hypothetical protein